MRDAEVYDVTVIGGGPAGLYAAFYAGMRDMKTKVIEYHPRLGGKLNVYLEKVIWDIGGLPPTRGEKVVEHLAAQGTTFDPTVVLGERVIKVEREDEVFRLVCEGGGEHLSRTVILAIGYGVLNPKRLPIDGAQKFELTNLYYTVGSLARYRGKTVLVSGGGDAAIDWANTLEKIAGKVILSHRRDGFAAHERSVSDLENSTVETMIPYQIKELHASGDEISSVSLENADTSQVERLDVDAVIVNHGYDLDMDFVDDNGLSRSGDYCIAVSERMETNISGIFAAGDLVDYEGKVHLISGCFVEAATAVNGAKKYLQPDADENAYVSSHNERFEERNRKLELQGAVEGL